MTPTLVRSPFELARRAVPRPALPDVTAEAQQRRQDREDRMLALGLLICFAVQLLVLWL